MGNTPLLAMAMFAILAAGCAAPQPERSRQDSIPAGAVKMTPEADLYPPILHSGLYEEPVPLGAPVDTAGAEDSPFITADGKTLYFFFTPDPNVPVQEQLFDNVTGIYESQMQPDGSWGEPARVVLQDQGKLALDGCQFAQGQIMWFCSAREGYSGMHWFTAEYIDGRWQGWKNADFDPSYQVGELHMSPDGDTMYFHSARAGGEGGLDIWESVKAGGIWQEPVGVAAVNTAGDEGWPYLSQNGSELWFTRTLNGTPSIWRSQRNGSAWGEPELVVSQFAGEPTLDGSGDLYFVHHFYKDGKMIEADIYVARRKG